MAVMGNYPTPKRVTCAKCFDTKISFIVFQKYWGGSLAPGLHAWLDVRWSVCSKPLSMQVADIKFSFSSLMNKRPSFC